MDGPPEPCAACGGTGRIVWYDDDDRPYVGREPCRTCAGTGAVPEHHATGEPGGYVEYVSCPDCRP